MGKQLSIYLNEIEAKRLTEIAILECRRPHDQARFFLLNALGLITANDTPVGLENNKSTVPTFHGEDGAFAGITNS